MTMSVRMTAVMAGFLHFPVDTSCSYLALGSGLHRVATTAGKQTVRLALACPPRMCSLPCHFPDCLEIGARPASFAACLPLNFPSSGMSVRGAQAVTLAMPGMLARMSALARNFSSAAMIVSTKSAIRASLQFGKGRVRSAESASGGLWPQVVLWQLFNL
jgi:hypothetical protein